MPHRRRLIEKGKGQRSNPEARKINILTANARRGKLLENCGCNT
jgi:hypothetical protein